MATEQPLHVKVVLEDSASESCGSSAKLVGEMDGTRCARKYGFLFSVPVLGENLSGMARNREEEPVLPFQLPKTASLPMAYVPVLVMVASSQYETHPRILPTSQSCSQRQFEVFWPALGLPISAIVVGA